MSSSEQLFHASSIFLIRPSGSFPHISLQASSRNGPLGSSESRLSSRTSLQILDWNADEIGNKKTEFKD